jgi:hypothetical protein
MLGEAAQVLRGTGPLTGALAQQVFVKDHVASRFGIGIQRWIPAQVRLRRDTLPDLPALPLIDAQNSGQLDWPQRSDLSKEGIDIGPLAPAPQLLQVPGRVDLVNRI